MLSYGPSQQLDVYLNTDRYDPRGDLKYMNSPRRDGEIYHRALSKAGGRIKTRTSLSSSP